MKQLFFITLLLPFSAVAIDNEYMLVIKDQHFQPTELNIPSGKKVKLEISNQNDTPAEFESADMSREVIVPAHSKATIYLGPLEPGSYRFLNDFNHQMEGAVVVKAVPNKGD